MEVTLSLDKEGEYFTASCPSGISRGAKEMIELTDKDFSRFQGKEVSNAIKKINEAINPVIKGINPIEQGKIDRKLIDLDGTPNKANLGVNAILPVSMAVAKAGAHVAKRHLFVHLNHYFNELIVEEEDLKIGATDYKYQMPRAVFNLINGGRHAHNNLSFQEFLLIPQKGTQKSFWEQLRMASETFHNLEKILLEKNLISGYGEEGGFAPSLEGNSQALDLLIQSAGQNGYKPTKDFTLGIDAAGALPKEASESPIEYFKELASHYPLELLEDPFPEDKWDLWETLNSEINPAVIVVGDDLTATNPVYLEKAIQSRAIKGMIIKPNQIGTITEVLRVVKIAKKKGIKLVVSHRSKETNDNFIADLAAGIAADFIKSGPPARGERTAKYNRLLEIDEMIV